jgi:fumarylacetoacetate (FAA) hydrolase family protein
MDMLHYLVPSKSLPRPQFRIQCVAKNSQEFLIIDGTAKDNNYANCLGGISINSSERLKNKLISKYAEMTMTLVGYVFCPILVNGTADNPRYHIKIVKDQISAVTTLCEDHKYPDGITLHLRNDRVKSRKRRRSGWGSSSQRG